VYLAEPLDLGVAILVAEVTDCNLLGVEGPALPLFLPLFWGKLDTGVTKDLRAGTATESRQAIDFELGVPNARLCLAPPLLGVAEVGRAKLLPCLAREGLGTCIADFDAGHKADFAEESDMGFKLPTFFTLDILC